MKLLSVFAGSVATVCLSALPVATSMPSPTHSTLLLSTARRDLAGASTAGAAVFGGGCNAGDYSTYVCDDPSDAIDIFKPQQQQQQQQQRLSQRPSSRVTFVRDDSSDAKLSEKRGWPTACATGGVVAFLFGGAGGQVPHSKAMDLLDVATDTVTTNSSTVDVGRWGTACTVAKGDIYFGGGKFIQIEGGDGTDGADGKGGGNKVGKVEPSMTDEVLRLRSGTDGKPLLDGLSLAGHLSLPREAIGAVTLPNNGVVFAGGSGPWPPVSQSIVDTYSVPIDGTEEQYKWKIDPINPFLNEYWLGVAQYNDSKIYIAGNTTLYVVGNETTFQGKDEPKHAKIIPAEGYDSSGIPAARMGQNGVRVEDVGVCFYSAAPSSLFCFTPTDGSYLWLDCSVGHIAGAITAVGKTVFVAGGADEHGNVTDVVDVFTWE